MNQPKVNSILIAKDNHYEIDENYRTIIKGKEYPVFESNETSFCIIREDGKKSCFSFNNWASFFELKEEEPVLVIQYDESIGDFRVSEKQKESEPMAIISTNELFAGARTLTHVENEVLNKTFNRLTKSKSTIRESETKETESIQQEYKLLVEEINRLQEEYDENGQDLPPIIKLQRIREHFNATIDILSKKEPIDIETEAKKALDEIHQHTTLCFNEHEENIFLQGFNCGFKQKALRPSLKSEPKETDTIQQEYNLLVDEINRLQEKYDENGVNCKPLIKLYRVKSRIEDLIKRTEPRIDWEKLRNEFFKEFPLGSEIILEWVKNKIDNNGR